MDSQELMQRILNEVEARLEEKNKNVPPQIVKMVEKSILLQVLDQLWKEHIATLDTMRHTISLRAYGQKDPLNEYKKEAFDMFSVLLDALKEKTTVVVCRTVIKNDAEEAMQKAQERQKNIKLNEVHGDSKDADNFANSSQDKVKSETVRHYTGEIDPKDPQTWGKVSRNDLCPCGSGKK